MNFAIDYVLNKYFSNFYTYTAHIRNQVVYLLNIFPIYLIMVILSLLRNIFEINLNYS